MTFPTYNPDLRYEMMNAILPDPQFENTPDTATVIDDLREILKLCYTYSAPQPPKEFSAEDLGNAIVSYLFATWTGREHDFEQYAKEYWEPTPVSNETPDPSVDPRGDPSVEGGLFAIEGI